MADAAGFTPIESRPPPRSQVGAAAWLRRNFFDGAWNTVLTLLVLLLLVLAVPPLLSWAVFHAVGAPDVVACRGAHAAGGA
jgi:general L-amino acid transport system permease protein